MSQATAAHPLEAVQQILERYDRDPGELLQILI